MRSERPKGSSLLELTCIYLFPIPCLVTSQQWLEISHSGSIYTMEIGKWYKLGFFSPKEFIINYLPLYHSPKVQVECGNQEWGGWWGLG